MSHDPQVPSSIDRLNRPVAESLKIRFGLLLGVLVLVLAGSLVLLQYMEGLEFNEEVAKENHERATLLARVIDLKGASLSQFANDYSQWDDMVAFSRAPTPEWAEVNIEASMKTYQVNAVWVFDEAGRQVYAKALSLSEGAVVPRFTPELMRSQFGTESAASFFLWEVGTLYECRVAHLRASSDSARTGARLGWFVVARAWGSEYFDSLSLLTQARIILRPGAIPPSLAEGGPHRLLHPLRNMRGAAVGWLDLRVGSSLIDVTREHDRVQLWLFVAFGVVAIGIVAFGVNIWVVQPLRLISTSLETEDIVPLSALHGDRSEMGRIASLVRISFEQRQALRDNEAILREHVRQRSELARNLHDGVIQTLYAAGMGVGGVASLIRTNPDEAMARLEHSRKMLNEVIREVRNYIEGMESERAPGGLGEALRHMADHMQAIRPFVFELVLEEPALAVLSVEENAHLLFIAREALSNALRHGRASHISVHLRREESGVSFRVADDGAGMPSGPRSSGFGLANIAKRAEEMDAGMSIAPREAGGTVLRIWIPIEDNA